MFSCDENNGGALKVGLDPPLSIETYPSHDVAYELNPKGAMRFQYDRR